MSEEQNYGFGKFVPGFDFLQNLAKGASQAQAKAGMPNLSSWIAPTLNVEELDKRISELKAVNFWLDQNSRALAATIQALELQKMTLVTLKGMNFDMSQIAEALKLKTDGADAGSGQAAKAASGSVDSAEPSEPPGSVAGAAKDAVAKARASKKSAQEAEEPQEGGSGPQEPKQAVGVVDPLQWWGALTQQFQEIASSAMREAANNPAIGAAREMASGVARQAAKAAAATAEATGGSAARKSSGGASRKTASGGKSAGAKKSARKSPAPGR